MQVLDNLQTDFKAEVIAASLLAKNKDFGKIIIERLGSNQRSHTKDVYRLHEELGQFDLNIQTVIKSFRQSIYDTMLRACSIRQLWVE